VRCKYNISSFDCLTSSSVALVEVSGRTGETGETGETKTSGHSAKMSVIVHPR
jgi:hypothetical protein